MAKSFIRFQALFEEAKTILVEGVDYKKRAVTGIISYAVKEMHVWLNHF